MKWLQSPRLGIGPWLDFPRSDSQSLGFAVQDPRLSRAAPKRTSWPSFTIVPLAPGTGGTAAPGGSLKLEVPSTLPAQLLAHGAPPEPEQWRNPRGSTRAPGPRTAHVRAPPVPPTPPPTPPCPALRTGPAQSPSRPAPTPFSTALGSTALWGKRPL